MSKEELEKISQRATRGDVVAMKDLMELASEFYDTGDFAKAAEIFEDAARCYRIDVGRQRGQGIFDSPSFMRSERFRKYFADWIADSDEFKGDVGKVTPTDLTDNKVREILYSKVITDSKNEDLLDDLFFALEKAGYQFSAPGNSFHRLLWYYVCVALGVSNGDRRKMRYLEKPEVGVLFLALLKEFGGKLESDQMKGAD